MAEILSDPTWAAVAGFLSREGLKWLFVGATVLVEMKAAKAKADNADTWEDLFWPKMLARLDKARAEQMRSGQ